MIRPFAALLALSIFTISPCHADDPIGARKAHEELQAALNPGGPAPSDAEMTAHLKAALKDLKNLPGNREDRSGQRRADAYIRAALYDIEYGATPNKTKGDIYDADSVVRDIEN